MQGSIILCWMGFKPILVYPKLPFRIKAVWCIISSKSSPSIQRTLKTFPHQKHIRIRQEFKGRGIGVPLPWDIIVAFFFHDLGRVKQILHISGKWKQGLLHPVIDEPPSQVLSTIIVSTWILYIPRISPQGPVSLTINRNEHAQLVTCVRADYLMKGPSPWPFPKSQWICSQCNLDCI